MGSVSELTVYSSRSWWGRCSINGSLLGCDRLYHLARNRPCGGIKIGYAGELIFFELISTCLWVLIIRDQ